MFQVAILDIDICGPSIPRVMGVVGEQVNKYFFFYIYIIYVLQKENYYKQPSELFPIILLIEKTFSWLWRYGRYEDLLFYNIF